jgi:hypothetical protein
VKRLARAFAVALVIALAPVVRSAGDTDGMLWVAVLQYDLLVPVAALVDGRWTFRVSHDDSQREDLAQAEGQLPARWLQGRALSQTWRAQLFSGGTKSVHVAGALIHDRFDEELRAVRTDSGLPAEDRSGSEGPFYGVATACVVDVRLFQEVEENKRQGIVEFFADRTRREARAAIKRHAASSAENAKEWAALTDESIDRGSFHVERVVAATRRDRSIVYYAEQYSDLMADCAVHVRATVSKSPSAAPRLVAISADTGCDNFVDFQPLAIAERNGHSCWLTAVLYEDGVDYVLAQPSHTDSDCRLK